MLKSGANKIIDEAVKSIEGADRAKIKNQCFKGLCPNLKVQYQLSEKAAREAKPVAGLHETGKFHKVSYHINPEKIWLTLSKGYQAFDSRISTFKDITNALSNPSVDMIGICGMGGIGKTMLVKEIARQVKGHKLFDEVVFVDVPQIPDIKKMQGQIADELGLFLCEESESGRARRLYARMKEEKKILVILDDIWARLDLETLGIPLGDEHKGCKVLLTSRSRGVLSREMDSEINFLVGILSQEESWSLFQKMVAEGDCIRNHDLQSLAVAIAKECAGLPIAIVTIAKALREENLFEWKNALLELKRPSWRNFSGVQAAACSTIELSFNFLTGEDLKSTLLLCSLMGYTYHASMLDLLKYGMGMGLFKDVNTMEEARDRACPLVHKLKACSLLLDSHISEMFAMHDIVRDVAISIASRDQHVFTMRNHVVPQEWLDKDTLKFCTAISLHKCDVNELPEELECPQLKFFYMYPKDPALKIPDKFFAGMIELRVLDLTKMHLLSLPSSLHLLVNLRTLCLDQSVLGDIAVIGELKQLEILSLSSSDIEHLPREIGRLSKLRSNASLDELKHLSRLTTLEIHIQGAKILPRGLFSKKLERYKILIGDEWDWHGKYETSRTLKLMLNTRTCLENGTIMQLKGIEDLYLGELQDVKNVLNELDAEGFLQLKHLHVQNSPYILCIVDSVEGVACDAFPLLESLFLHNLTNLEKICNGRLTAASFCNLGIIKVGNCNKLKSILSVSIARGLQQLQVIDVTECKSMEVILGTEEERISSNQEIELITPRGIQKCSLTAEAATNEITFSKLKSLSLSYLPSLTSFCLVNYTFRFPSLEELTVRGCPSMKIFS
ncbi:hypothetical protein CUMW_189420 [Citrus unshiu]|uniref:AAA+ ATPase domain-containing protein n=1 Tax=Citrus unshiu TaxID=55188 RepID=A0A2H5Q2F2_CITUN|nr:hypothetical protein CUMW_189420 [Citrus unshiu]